MVIFSKDHSYSQWMRTLSIVAFTCRHKKTNTLELVYMYQHKNAHYFIDLRCYHVYFLKLVTVILPLKTSK